MTSNVLLALLMMSWLAVSCQSPPSAAPAQDDIVPGALRMELYLPLLEDKRIGLVVNHTSIIADQHLVDTLLSHGIEVVKIFSPEHGFRGDADAGAKVLSSTDPGTGLPIVSLYGPHRKPTNEDLADIDLLVFDIQDVGVRFYTYISTLTLVMEAAAQSGISVLLLDRPNPNGHYVDGPVLEPAYTSFVGMHPVPIVYGMTIGEYAKMVNGQGWLTEHLRCALRVIPMANYHRGLRYDLPIAPSPNLPNALSIALYPSLCLMEGTEVSVGRGTDKQFQIYGHPEYQVVDGYRFMPVPMAGAASPKHQDMVCYGRDLTGLSVDSIRHQSQLSLQYISDALSNTETVDFFLTNGFFDKLAGNATLRAQLTAGVPEATIRASWRHGIDNFLAIRSNYLLYP